MASFFDSILDSFGLELRAKTLPDKRPVDPSSAGYFVAPSNYSGIDVSEIGSLNLSAVFACVRAISDSMASLPLILYRKDANGRKVRADHDPRYWVLKEQGNAYMTSYEVRQAMFSNLLLWGVAYSELEHDSSGKVTGMFPVRSDRVKVSLKDSELFYTITIPGGEQVTLPSYKIHTFKLLTLDGFSGVSPIKLAASSLGLTMAAEQFGARYFASGGSVAGIVKHPAQLSEEAFQRLEKSFAGGLSDSHKVRILEEGMDYQSISLDSESMQFLETRQFQTNEIAR